MDRLCLLGLINVPRAKGWPRAFGSFTREPWPPGKAQAILSGACFCGTKNTSSLFLPLPLRAPLYTEPQNVGTGIDNVLGSNQHLLSIYPVPGMFSRALTFDLHSFPVKLLFFSFPIFIPISWDSEKVSPLFLVPQLRTGDGIRAVVSYTTQFTNEETEARGWERTYLEAHQQGSGGTRLGTVHLLCLLLLYICAHTVIVQLLF